MPGDAPSSMRVADVALHRLVGDAIGRLHPQRTVAVLRDDRGVAVARPLTEVDSRCDPLLRGGAHGARMTPAAEPSRSSFVGLAPFASLFRPGAPDFSLALRAGPDRTRTEMRVSQAVS